MRNSASCREPVSTVIPGERLIHLVGKLPDLDWQARGRCEEPRVLERYLAVTPLRVSAGCPRCTRIRGYLNISIRRRFRGVVHRKTPILQHFLTIDEGFRLVGATGIEPVTSAV